tara:strand:+ start:1106 stop:2416 length:1311 start_codon:yes stop_codon:yes gene_type:complete
VNFNLEVSKSLIVTESVSGSLAEVKEQICFIKDNSDFRTEITPLTSVHGWEFNEDGSKFGHESGRFFSLQGIEYGQLRAPILVQPEVGILGFLVAFFDGVLHVLSQLKIEPGNKNGIQLGPTVQATRSNYSRVHGGSLPKFLEYFLPDRSSIPIMDRYESEQGWRYFRKRNRNSIMLVSDPPSSGSSHIWMTLGQVKELSKQPLFLNACARSVLSLFPKKLNSSSKILQQSFFTDEEIQTRLIDAKETISDQANLVSLLTLDDWKIQEGIFCHKDKEDFRIIGVSVQAKGREVKNWSQPLLQESNIGEYGLLIGTINGVVHVFWQLRDEPGLWDRIELGPSWILRSSVQENYSCNYQAGKEGNLLLAIDLAEEGGRFYHAIFRHKIVWIGETQFGDLDPSVVPLTIKQTETFIQYGQMITMEGRSLWALVDGDWFE